MPRRKENVKRVRVQQSKTKRRMLVQHRGFQGKPTTRKRSAA